MHRSAIIGAALGCALALGGCGAERAGDEAPPSPGSAAESAAPDQGDAPAAPEDAAHTRTDQDFAEQLRAHHQQALELLALAEHGGGSPATTGFAAQVRPQRQAELAELESWLATSRGQQSGSAPEDTDGDVSPVPGELTPEAVQRLRQARGADFDRGFEQAMRGLYDGAEQLAQTELDEGSAPPMRSLAERLLDRQDAERVQLDAI